MEIMSSDDVSKVALAQRSPHKVSLAQLRSNVERKPTQRIAASFLAEKARKINSRVLSLIATRASADPFGKVVKMIKDMIQRLMEQANDEADHKAFCDTEMATNKLTRNTKTDLVAQLQATIEELTAEINETAQKVVQTEAAIAELSASLTQATKERQAEKAANQVT